MIVMVAGGFGLAALLLWLAAMLTGKYAWHVWNHLEKIYQVRSMQYWFKRMQDNGTHVLRKEHDNTLKEKQK